jgi:8-oxo-dGTP pyrophosphatase MutT (NUDIX family)
MTPHHRSHVFLLRDGSILALEQATGARWWELPGGDLLPGESPATAAIRETFEETGIRIDTPELLREWHYVNRRGEEVQCYAFAVAAPDGDVVRSEEHSAHVWLGVDEYERRYCSRTATRLAPEWTQQFFAEMRENCQRFRNWVKRSATG